MGEVIHVDTAHADAEGFWYARSYEERQSGGRTFLWYYQTRGMTCDFRDTRPVFRPWTNDWMCDTELDVLEAGFPGYIAADAECRAAQPWSRAIREHDGIRWTLMCQGLMAGGTSGLIPAVPATPFTCAPWEGVNCNKVSYPWAKSLTSVVPSMWRPAAATCTGLPANANRHKAPLQVATNVAEGCSGADVAPNCPAGDTGIACTRAHTRNEGQNNPAYGWVKATGTASASDLTPVSVTVTRTASASDLTPVSVTVTRTASASDLTPVSVTVTRTATATREVAAGAPVKVTKKYKKKNYSAAVAAHVTLKASASASHTETTTVGRSTEQGTGECYARTTAAAKSCATARAKTDAKYLLTDVDVGAGAHEGPYDLRNLRWAAEARAEAKALTAAKKKVAAQKATTAQIKAAKKKATTKVNTKITKAKKAAAKKR
ncbi:hypothetical protein [Nocardioides yefusunii]|uniref:Uncharacterized protein n=1 Tax=Nocardioides yefusunii TaxID=2500546 RepID=A0ABW1QVQ4_9ACTN|nr:hypothetical protein [Nocardioides yefusunii]